MYMRVYAFTYMRIWVDSHRVETKREGMVRMAPFISENIDLVPCMAMAFNAAIATMGFLKMVAWTEHGMSSRMSRYIDRFGKMGIDREILEVYARSYLDESRNALICWIVGLAITMAVGIVIWAHDVGAVVLLTSVVAAAVSIRCIVMAVRDVADIRDVLAEIDLRHPDRVICPGIQSIRDKQIFRRDSIWVCKAIWRRYLSASVRLAGLL